MEYLSLETNTLLSGTIPDALYGLPNMKELNLFQTRISGSLSLDLGQWTNLQHLEIGSFLTGSIPPALGSLSHLEKLKLDGNSLTGTLVPLHPLSRLQHLELAENQLSGSIPADFFSIPAWKSTLWKLHLQGNLLTGKLPDEIWTLTQLQTIRLSNNLELTGSLPEGLQGLTTLIRLDLSNNAFTGTIPFGAFSNSSSQFRTFHA
ncbi:Leucine rich repeat N-terminal domain [Seminavis robusta]|uniref:Leucine rich repeat N-terminal domain n=1 Tax=Seminavis robusta TaxID=568900 RepID=A0A9N8EEV8_9STRA|nr:Leucine rich repeat N-terminal domain [Seminavis robusta]|eukprot:Sro991_g228740.1 Leucine rich repeat N-terminal domain (205) ;mRNA; r:36435-37049